MGGLDAAAEAWFAVAARITIGLAAGSLMVAAVLRKFPNVSPEARHGLWALVLLQGLLWFHIPVWVPAPAQPEDQPAAQADSPTAVPGMPTVGQRSDEIPPSPSVTPRATPGPIDLEPTIAEAASPPEASNADIGPTRAFSWKLVLAGVWAAGAVSLVLVTAFRFLTLRFRVMAGATPVPRSVQQAARELARRHGYRRDFRARTTAGGCWRWPRRRPARSPAGWGPRGGPANCGSGCKPCRSRKSAGHVGSRGPRGSWAPLWPRPWSFR